jgi:hypothetical protein
MGSGLTSRCSELRKLSESLLLFSLDVESAHCDNR